MAHLTLTSLSVTSSHTHSTLGTPVCLLIVLHARHAIATLKVTNHPFFFYQRLRDFWRCRTFSACGTNQDELVTLPFPFPDVFLGETFTLGLSSLCVCSLAKLCLTLCNPTDCGPPGSSMGFPRQDYWSGLPFPTPGDLPNPGMEPMSPVSPALACEFLTTEPPGKPLPIVKTDSFPLPPILIPSQIPLSQSLYHHLTCSIVIYMVSIPTPSTNR